MYPELTIYDHRPRPDRKAKGSPQIRRGDRDDEVSKPMDSLGPICSAFSYLLLLETAVKL